MKENISEDLSVLNKTAEFKISSVWTPNSKVISVIVSTLCISW